MPDRVLLAVKDEPDIADLVSGGFLWMVFSWRGEAFAPELIEAFDSYDWAILCGEQRMAEGFSRVEVCQRIAFTASAELVAEERAFLEEEQRQTL